MVIDVYRSGGFAGSDQVRLGRLDTAALTLDDQSRVHELTNQIENPPAGSEPIGADMLEYRVELQMGDGEERAVTILDDMDPDNPQLRAVEALLEIIGSRQ